MLSFKDFYSLFKVKQNKLPKAEEVDYETALAFFKKKESQYEDITDFLKDRVNPDDTVLDVGANIGYFSAILFEKINFNGEAHLFEPVPNLADACRKTFRSKPWRVHIHPFALGDKDGRVNIFTAADGNIGWNTLEIEKISKDMKPLEIEIRRFYFPEIINVGLVKIDVEGAEYKVLRGMIGSFKNYKKLPLLVVEVGWGKNSHPHWDQEIAVFKEFLELGYKTVDVTNNEIDVTRIVSTTDVVFLPPS